MFQVMTGPKHAGVRAERAPGHPGCQPTRQGVVSAGIRQPADPAWFLFLDPCATEFYVDWERLAQDAVPAATGRGRPGATWWWAAHNVHLHCTGSSARITRRRDLTLTFEALLIR